MPWTAGFCGASSLPIPYWHTPPSTSPHVSKQQPAALLHQEHSHGSFSSYLFHNVQISLLDYEPIWFFFFLGQGRGHCSENQIREGNEDIHSSLLFSCWKCCGLQPNCYFFPCLNSQRFYIVPLTKKTPPKLLEYKYLMWKLFPVLYITFDCYWFYYHAYIIPRSNFFHEELSCWEEVFSAELLKFPDLHPS